MNKQMNDSAEFIYNNKQEQQNNVFAFLKKIFFSFKLIYIIYSS